MYAFTSVPKLLILGFAALLAQSIIVVATPVGGDNLVARAPQATKTSDIWTIAGDDV
ncbi:hypothetical protein H1R20_g4147, partial [Candolleomyces eurysporus]